MRDNKSPATKEAFYAYSGWFYRSRDSCLGRLGVDRGSIFMGCAGRAVESRGGFYWSRMEHLKYGVAQDVPNLLRERQV